MYFLDQKNVATAQQNLELFPGNFEAFYIRVNGTHGSSYARTAVGNILFTLNGRVFQSWDFDHMGHITNRLFGTAENTAGTTFAFSVLVPMAMPGMGAGIPGIGNALHIDPNDTAYFTIPAQGTTTANATLYGIPSMSLNKFHMQIQTITRTLASGTELFDCNARNVFAIFIWDAATTDPTNVEIYQDGQQKYNASWTDGENFGNMLSRVETAIAGHFIDLNPTRRSEELVNRHTEVKIIGGAGAQSFTILSAIFDIDRYNASYRAVNQKVRQARRMLPAPSGLSTPAQPVVGV